MKLLFILLFLASCSEPQKWNCEKDEVVKSPKFKSGDCVTSSSYEFEIPLESIFKITKVGKLNYQYKGYYSSGKFFIYETSFYSFDEKFYKYRVISCPKKLEKVK